MSKKAKAEVYAQKVVVAEPKKTGRPSLRTPEIVEDIVEKLSRGITMVDICAPDDMPVPRTVRRWTEEDEAVKSAIAGAREDGADAIASRVRETARGRGDSAGDVQRDKLIIDTDLKLLSKWDRRYADKVEISGGEDLGINAMAKVLDPLNELARLMGDK